MPEQLRGPNTEPPPGYRKTMNGLVDTTTGAFTSYDQFNARVEKNNREEGFQAVEQKEGEPPTRINPTTGDVTKQMGDGSWVSASEYAQRMKSGINPDGSPIYKSLNDAATGMLKDQYQMKPSTIDPTKLEGYSKYKGEALRTGPSAWLGLALENQKLEEAKANDQAVANAKQAEVGARSTLAMRGGLSSGARERLATNSANQLMYGKQNVGQQGAISRAALGLEDEKSRVGMLENFAKAEGGLAQYNTNIGNAAKEFNIRGSIDEKRAEDAYKMDRYKKQMEMLGAEKTAQAAESGGGGK